MAKKDSTIVKSLENDIEKIKNALDKIMNDVETIQDGNDGNPYWNGKNAYTTMKVCLANLDHHQTLLKNIQKCSKTVKKRADKQKKC